MPLPGIHSAHEPPANSPSLNGSSFGIPCSKELCFRDPGTTPAGAVIIGVEELRAVKTFAQLPPTTLAHLAGAVEAIRLLPGEYF